MISHQPEPIEQYDIMERQLKRQQSCEKGAEHDSNPAGSQRAIPLSVANPTNLTLSNDEEIKEEITVRSITNESFFSRHSTMTPL